MTTIANSTHIDPHTINQRRSIINNIHIRRTIQITKRIISIKYYFLSTLRKPSRFKRNPTSKTNIQPGAGIIPAQIHTYPNIIHNNRKIITGPYKTAIQKRNRHTRRNSINKILKNRMIQITKQIPKPQIKRLIPTRIPRPKTNIIIKRHIAAILITIKHQNTQTSATIASINSNITPEPNAGPVDRMDNLNIRRRIIHKIRIKTIIMIPGNINNPHTQNIIPLLSPSRVKLLIIPNSNLHPTAIIIPQPGHTRQRIIHINLDTGT